MASTVSISNVDPSSFLAVLEPRPPNPPAQQVPLISFYTIQFWMVCQCRCVGYLGATAALLCSFLNVITVYITLSQNPEKVFEILARCFTAGFGAAVVCGEAELTSLLQNVKALNTVVGRATLQLYVAVMTRANAVDYGGEKLTIFHDVVTYLLLAAGFLYLLSGMGMMCTGEMRVGAEREAEAEVSQTAEINTG